MLPAPTVAPTEVDRVVREVLSQERFEGAGGSFWDRVLDLLLGGLAELIDLVFGNGAGRVAGVALVFLAAVAVLVAAVAFSRRVRRSGAAGRGPDVGTRGRSAAQWREAARAAAEAGECREAVRCHYRATVAELAAAGLVEEVPGHTAGQYLADVRRDVPAAADPFADATAAFERAWYADAPVTTRDVDAAATAASATLEAAGIRTPVAGAAGSTAARTGGP